jgi:hypothetical protein
MPADRHDLPALERLTADVADAMRAAEHRPAARWWRRMPPLAVTLLALAVPSAIALHATTGDGDDGAVGMPGVPALHCDGGQTVGVALLLTAGASVGVRPGVPVLSRRAGFPTAAAGRRSCA